MKYAILLIVAITLTACGVDGEPSQPSKANSGIAISGTAKVGIVKR